MVKSAFLLPLDFSDLYDKSLFHLYEHLLVRKLEKRFGISMGITTEDYIILFGNHENSYDVEEFFKYLKSIVFDENTIKSEKESVIFEIKSAVKKDNEKFFEIVWKDTMYAKSPLGCVKSIKAIKDEDLYLLNEKILNNNIYKISSLNHCVESLFSFRSVECVNDYSLSFLKKKIYKFMSETYFSFYFRGIPDVLYFIQDGIKIIAPESFVYLSEKKYFSVLIVKNINKLPNYDEIFCLRKDIYMNFRKKVKNIRKNFKDFAINKLESTFFYNNRYEQRVDKIKKVTMQEMQNIMSFIQI